MPIPCPSHAHNGTKLIYYESFRKNNQGCTPPSHDLVIESLLGINLEVFVNCFKRQILEKYNLYLFIALLAVWCLFKTSALKGIKFCMSNMILKQIRFYLIFPKVFKLFLQIYSVIWCFCNTPYNCPTFELHKELKNGVLYIIIFKNQYF